MSRRFRRRRLLDVLGLTPLQQKVIATGCFTGFILLFIVCGGLMKLNVGQQPPTRPATNAPVTGNSPPKAGHSLGRMPKVSQPSRYGLLTSPPKAGSRYKLTGTIRKLEGYIRLSGAVRHSITIEHNGITGMLNPGTQEFKAYDGPPEAALNVTVRNLKMDKSAVGRKIDFVIEWHGQWVVIELTGKR